ncbi:MAG: ATP-binding protein [Myxococcota bacterium]|nr:ATP-binding protein [Myxococcota bacterium]
MIQTDVTSCDVEPIHVPGAIQPHGVLVVLAANTFEILQISANSADYFGVAPDAVLHRPLAALLGPAADAALAGVRRATSTAGEPFTITVDGAGFDARAHRHRGIAILEIERRDETAAFSDAALRTALARLQRSNSVSELCAIAVDAVRALTGFDRVLLYRFDDEGHGDVIDEALTDGVDSYRGLRFPASDIPRQARELYLLNWLRLIPDASYEPVPLVPPQRPDTRDAVDLSFATLRSVSPVHLEYLRNMGVGASMSVSLLRAETLWGLIACHHRSPRHVSLGARAACEVVGRVVSLQLAAQEQLESRTRKDALRGTEARLAEAMHDALGDVATALLQRGDALLQLVEATGAAVCTAEGIQTVGATPGPAQLAALVRWLTRQGSRAVFHTDALGLRHPSAAEYADVASGLLAMTLPGTPPSYVCWFRPEVVRTVTWAGNPAKAIAPGTEGGRLHPRHSFDAWREVVRARARPWSRVEIEAAEDLRRRAIEADLVKQIARAEKAVTLRDEMVAVLSHDLKSPLQVLGLSIGLLAHRITDDPVATEAVERMQRSVSRMDRLIRDLLDLAKIEAGRFEVTQAPTAVSALVTDAMVLLTPIAEAKSVALQWIGDGEARVVADADRVFQVFSNLVGNAIKFTPAGGRVTLDATRIKGWVRFAVRDTGPGIAASELPNLFERYWQARRVQSMGAGLGLYIAKGIVEAHGGRIWAESERGAGSTFYFTLAPADR